MGEQKEGIFLSQKENLTWNIFVNLELDIDFSVWEEQEDEGNWT